MRRKKQMSTLEDYEVVDLYARACADALVIEIKGLGGNVIDPEEPDTPEEPDIPDVPDVPDEPIEPGEPVYIVNPDGGKVFNNLYLQVDGTPMEYHPSSIYGEQAMVYRRDDDALSDSIVWKIMNGYDEYRSLIFTSILDCRAYSKLRVKYHTNDKKAYTNYMTNILLISRYEIVGNNSEQVIEYHDIIDVSKHDYIPTDNTWSTNADSTEWEWIEIDISEIDSLYLGFRSWGTFAISAVQLAN